MGHSTKTKIFNFIWFQTIWFLAIIYEDNYLLVIVGLLVVNIAFSKHKWESCLFGLSVALYGSIVDGALRYTGVFSFTNSFYWLIPYWLVALWMAFGMMLRVSLNYLQNRYWLSAILGAITGPLSYVAGERLGAVNFSQSLMTTILILAVIWAVTVPLWLWLDGKIIKRRKPGNG